MVEVNSETDFVAKNEEFIIFVEGLAKLALDNDAADLEAFSALPFEGSTVKDVLTEKIAKIGENMNIRRFTRMDQTGVKYVGYLHGNGKIGVVVGLETEAPISDVSVCGKDVAMQVASMNPKFLDESQVDPEYLENEKKILVQQALNEGKSADIVEKMVTGRLKKELKETCLVEQKFVKDNDLTVKQYVENTAEEIGKSIKVVSMARYEVGEGIEKKEENFAEEVAKQMGN